MKLIKSLYLLGALLSVCSCSNTSSINDTVIKVDDGYNYYKNDKYVVGKRIFDKNYYSDDVPFSIEEPTFTLEEIPEITFKTKSGYVYFEDSSGDAIAMNWSMYIADVNQDGHFDVCYCDAKGSGFVSYEAYVYDVFNGQYLLEKADRNAKNYDFDLDENNVLCLLEGHATRGNYQRVHQVGRFLKDTKDSMFEWYNYDIKLIGINVMFRGKPALNVTNELTGAIYGYVDFSKDPTITSNDLIIEKVSGPNFTYEFADFNTSTGSFTMNFRFSEVGNSKIKFKIGNIFVVYETNVQ